MTTSTPSRVRAGQEGAGPQGPAAPSSSTGSVVDLSAVARELGRIQGPQPGPTLICLGGLHGNEPAGVLGIARVFAQIGERPEGLCGRFVGLSGNRRALALGCRFVEHDLNRAWTPNSVEQLLALPGPLADEDQEMLELHASLTEVIGQAEGRVYLLDLHTTSAPGPAFAILDDTLPNREVALDFPVPLVLGLEEKLSGTLASYMTARGVTVVGFEAGPHADPASVDRAAAAIWIALDSCGLFEAGSRSEVVAARDLLSRQTGTAARMVEVRYRHPVDARDGFRMDPGFASFEPIRAGQAVGSSLAGRVRSPRSGLLLMPLYQDQGNDAFFLVDEVRPVWMPISAALRRLHLERFLHLLPGVQPHPDRPQTFVVDRRYARWRARQLFHLLGFRQENQDGPRLTMTRRQDRLR